MIDSSASLSLLSFSLKIVALRENDNLYLFIDIRTRDLLDRSLSLKTAYYEERDIQARVKVTFLHVIFFIYCVFLHIESTHDLLRRKDRRYPC